MQIGEIAKQSGFSKDTLRYYEKIGLLQLDKKQRGENNYRFYDSAILQKLNTIKSLKQVGFTLKEIKKLLSMDESNRISCQSVGAIVQPKIVKIEAEILKLQMQKRKLLQLMGACEGDCVATFVQYKE